MPVPFPKPSYGLLDAAWNPPECAQPGMHMANGARDFWLGCGSTANAENNVQEISAKCLNKWPTSQLPEE